MNKLSILVLKSLRKIYSKIFYISPTKPSCELDPNKASQLIFDKLMDDKPCMIARFGSTELTAMVNYLGVKYSDRDGWKYIKGETLPWWWNKNILDQMQQWSGFFPPTQTKMEQFCELMLKDIKEVDVLGSWLAEEKYFEQYLLNNQNVHLRLLEPFWSSRPWTKALEGKKVLIVHPFADDILAQYKQRKHLFKDKGILPDFHLELIPAVQSLGGDDNHFDDWFEALQWMKDEIDLKDYDVCLIGCGAYGFPLAAHVKRKGKKAVHLGGALQLLFGIRGKRWEDPNYGVKEWGIPVGSYSSLMNEYWIRPGEKSRPKNADEVEGACYW